MLSLWTWAGPTASQKDRIQTLEVKPQEALFLGNKPWVPEPPGKYSGSCPAAVLGSRAGLPGHGEVPG